MLPVKADAEVLHRAETALRCAVRQADHRPKLHERLVEVAGALFRHDFREAGGYLFPVFRVGDGREIIVEPRRDAQNVAVYRRDAQTEADGRDRPGGILPDARQRKKRLEIRRKRTAVL